MRDLQPYLGAMGPHANPECGPVAVSAFASDGMIAETADRSTLRRRPLKLRSWLSFGRGDYRIWTQFQRGGRVSTVSYVVRVAP